MGFTTYDKCGEISYRIKNLDGQDRIKNFDDQEKIFKRDVRVQIVLDKRNKNSFTHCNTDVRVLRDLDGQKSA